MLIGIMHITHAARSSNLRKNVALRYRKLPSHSRPGGAPDQLTSDGDIDAILCAANSHAGVSSLDIVLADGCVVTVSGTQNISS